MMKTKRISFKPFLSSTLCALLVFLSPGIEPYLFAQSVIQGQTADAGAAASGVGGAAASISLKLAPASISLAPAALSGSVLVAPSIPTLAGPKDAVSRAVGGLRAALPVAAAAVRTAAAKVIRTPQALIPSKSVAAPVSEGSATPVQRAQSALKAGVEQISKTQGESGRKAVLDSLFTGERVQRTSDDAPVVEAGSNLGSLHGGLLKPSRSGPPAAEARGSERSPQDILSRTKVFLTRAGQEPVSATLATLGEALAASPDFKASLNKEGRIRVVLSKDTPHGGLVQADVEKLQQALSGYGITARLQVENIPIDWSRGPAKTEEAAGQSSSAPQHKAGINPITLPFREAAYLGRTFAASYTSPTKAEILGGIATKAFPSFLAVGVWASQFAGFPVAMAAAIGLSLALNAFHGIWINTWSNFQNNIAKQRGLQYQTIFNLLYGQWWGAAFRTIAWTVIPKTIPPWALGYWKDMGVSTIAGTFFGSLGYQGLNALYDHGRLNRWQRGAIQQLRDIFFCLAGTFFSSGSMVLFWTMFAAQQGLDLAIYLVGLTAKRRPILYVADEMVAASPEFQGMYPVGHGSGEQLSPLKAALKMLLESPFVKPVVWLVKKLLSVLGKKK